MRRGPGDRPLTTCPTPGERAEPSGARHGEFDPESRSCRSIRDDRYAYVVRYNHGDHRGKPLDYEASMKPSKIELYDLKKDPWQIVETIIVMSHHLGLDAIAEGVETHAALAFLRAKGCERFQGYLYVRAPAGLTGWVANSGTRRPWPSR